MPDVHLLRRCSGGEPEPRGVEEPEPGTPTTVPAVGAGQRPGREADPDRAQRLGRERQRPRSHQSQPRPPGVETVEELQTHARAEA